MADCAMIGRCVGVRNYTKKDNTPGCIVTVAGSNGGLVQFTGNRVVSEFPFGTVVSVHFDITVFDGRPSRLVLEGLEEVKS